MAFRVALSPPRCLSVYLPILAALLPVQRAVAQCGPQWVSGAPWPSLGNVGNGNGIHVAAMHVWDVDGPGPAPRALAVGGYFRDAGGLPCNGIAAYDFAEGTWSNLGPGFNGTVLALTSLASGELIAGGSFSNAGSVAVANTARWNGIAWSPLGTGTNGRVKAVLALPNGDLIAAGSFSTAGGAPAHNIARWDGSNWSPLGTGLNNDRVNALAMLPNGELVAGGNFTIAGGVSCWHVARWLNGTWSPMGTGMAAEVDSFTMLRGDLVAGVRAVGSTPSYVMRWSGSAWSVLAPPVGVGPVHCYALATLPDGSLIAGGNFAPAAIGANYIARWDGVSWSNLGVAMDASVLTLITLPNGDLVAGGYFTMAGGVPGGGVARWNGTAWSALGLGMNGAIHDFLTMPNGDLIAGGAFTTAGGIAVNRVARWTNGSWSAFGPGMNGVVHALEVMSNGDLVTGGQFTTVGGVSMVGIARWNGTSWSPLGSGIPGIVRALVALPNGDLVAGGYFTVAGGVLANNIALWSNGAWSALGTGVSHQVEDMLRLPSGDLIVGGSFSNAGSTVVNGIARWDGSTWSPLGGGTGHIQGGLALLPGGDLIAVGGVGSAGTNRTRVARWNGSTWTSVGTGVNAQLGFDAVAVLPNGDLVVGGTNVGWGTCQRWNGITWSQMVNGLDGGILALHTRPNGELAVGGAFIQANGALSPYFGRYVPTCPATASSTGFGCANTGSTNPNTYTALNAPWTGSTFRARGAHLAQQAVVAVATGFSRTSVPLAAILPPSPRFCELLVFPDLVDVTPAVAGTVDTQLAIPDVASLAGLVLYQQLVVLATQPAENTSSNALMLTLGTM